MGTSKDEARAAALYTKACDAGERTGCFNLGVLFSTGRGVGCALGDTYSCTKAPR